MIAVDLRLSAPVALHAAFPVRGFTALLGRSGEGKTSLLRALAGLLPSAGTPWAGLAPECRPVGYLPQETLLFPHLSVLENTAYALKGRGRLEEARRLLAALGLEALAQRRPAQLSGGQAKRVALARALAHRPDLLLLDEPSAGLDRQTCDETLGWLKQTAASWGIPVLAATHDYDIAVQADALALLAGGRIIQFGPTMELFAAPVSPEAAALLGV